MRLPIRFFLTLILGGAMFFRPASAQESSANPQGTAGANIVAPDLTVMSFNIRFNNPDDGEDAWPHRAEGVAALIERHEADIVGLQEALPGQLVDLDDRLPGYAWLGISRGGEGTDGELSAILYRTAAVRPVAHGTFWLSETPDEPASRGWDAALPRIATWARFELPDADAGSGTRPEILHLNTHFDHRGEQARIESARLVRRWLTEHAGDRPVVVTGDFNAVPDSEPIKALTGPGEGIDLQDALDSAVFPHEGPLSTWNGFEAIVPDRRIDFVFVNDGVQVLRHAILPERLENGRFPSDHLPVLAEIAFRPTR